MLKVSSNINSDISTQNFIEESGRRCAMYCITPSDTCLFFPSERGAYSPLHEETGSVSLKISCLAILVQQASWTETTSQKRG
jgi:hypothetical protein